MSIFSITKGTKRILSIMLILTAIAISIAYFYFSGLNKTEDPRIIEAKKMLIEFDKRLAESHIQENRLFPILDSIENIFQSVPGYTTSFEMGVIHNNRASAEIMIAIYNLTDSVEKFKLLEIAKSDVLRSIEIYENWLNEYSNLTSEQIKTKILPYFKKDDKAFEDFNYDKILNRRIENIELAKVETPRRLSVSYTNLGIIYRHNLNFEKAIESYEKALKLWKLNPTAKTNLNTMLGLPPEDESIIQKLFPPDREKAE